MTTSETRQPSREEWRRIRALAEEAFGLPTQEREALLAQGCADQPELERAVRCLLELDREAPAYEIPRPSLLGDAQRPKKPAERIGPYELRRCLGTGGMGSVWLAIESEGDFHRSVALKLLHASLGREELLARFQRERQVLANLDHPGIARLIDGGVSAEGTPYLVMEYVEGLRIDRWCDEQGLTLRARLELFLAVCDAVQHAHQRLVVHRDLKPGNILVTAAGAPKLLDFGIAKVLDPEKQAWSEVTQGVMRYFTPSYASPEQVQGRVVTTASDVYSLGVLLYQLLAGRLPHELENTSSTEIARILTEVEPERPSAAVLAPRVPCPGSTERSAEDLGLVARRRGTTTRRLARSLAGDLDRIVLKSLRPEPLRRYATVLELSADVRRYLAGLPITARPDGALYRCTRFVRRNRLAVGLATLLFVSLCLGLVFSLRSSRSAARAHADEHVQRELAQSRARELEQLSAELATRNAELERSIAQERALSSERDEARELAVSRAADIRGFSATLIFDLYGRLYKIEGATDAARALLQTGLGYLDRLAKECQDDPAVLRQLAHGHLHLYNQQAGLYHANLGQLEEGEKSLDRAAELVRLLAPTGELESRDRVLASQIEVSRGDLLRRRGDDLGAFARYAQAVRHAEPLEHDPDAGPRERYFLMTAIGRVAEWQVENGRLEEAEESYAHAQFLLEQLVIENPGESAYLNDLANVYRELSELLALRGEDERALELAQASLEQAEELAQAQPSNYILARSRVMALFQLAMLREKGALAEARRLFARACSESARLLTLDPDNAMARREFVIMHLQAAGLELRAGEWTLALPLLELALPAAEERSAKNPSDLLARFELVQTQLDLGRCQLALGFELEAGGNLARVGKLLEGLAEASRAEGVLTRYYAQTTHRFGTVLHEHALDESASARALGEARAWLEQAEEAFRTLGERGQALPLDVRDLTLVRAELERVHAAETERTAHEGRQ